MGKRLRLLAKLFITVTLLFGFTHQVEAQEGIEFRDVRVEHRFGEEIRFSAQIQAASPVSEILLVFREINEENTRVIPLSADSDGRVSYAYDAHENLLRPFAKITYWFQVTLADGTQQSSEKYFFLYEDNRFDWQMREEDNLRVHWSEGDEAFGLAALDTARNGVAKIQSLFSVDTAQPIDVYIYPTHDDLQSALFMGGEDWIAGHASPDLGVVFVSIAPSEEQQILMQQQIPHELAHVLLYRHVGKNYNRLPTWLQEGLASLAELYPNPDYELALQRAMEKDALIPLSELCAPFPRDASQAFLAYAEATSFTRYLQKNYGSSGLDELIAAYADGLACDAGTMRVFGKSLDYLDANWQESVLGANLFTSALRATAPYVFLLALFLAAPLFSGILALKKS